MLLMKELFIVILIYYALITNSQSVTETIGTNDMSEGNTNTITDDLNNNTDETITFSPIIGPTRKTVDLDPKWLAIVNNAQAVMLVAGVAVNIFTIITLKVSGSDFTPVIKTILTHQSAVDGIICVCSIINLVTVPNSLVGANWFSLFICQAWHSQGIYWSLTWVSIANLQLFALERYIATCFPFKHSSFTRKTLYKIIPTLYPIGFLVNFFGYIQVIMI